MALSTVQQTSLLFKQMTGAAETKESLQFFEETKLGKQVIYADQLWGQSGLIPSTAPVGMTDGQTIGVVKRHIDLVLTPVVGAPNAFYHADLIDAIPSNQDRTTGTYVQSFKTAGGTAIGPGSGDWFLNNAAGTVMFYGTLPAGVSAGTPPKISFFKYVGIKGIPEASAVATPKMDTFTLGAAQTSVTLASTPSDLTAVIMFIKGGLPQLVGQDFSLGGTGNKEVSWVGYGLESQLAENDVIKISYSGV
jgi:hypothetical protein